MDSVEFRARVNQLSAEQAERIIAHHTLPEQVGEVFKRVKPRLAVYSHTAGTERLLAKTREVYSGPLEIGEDLMTLEIDDTIKVHRFTGITR
jgi:ribonuclease Z